MSNPSVPPSFSTYKTLRATHKVAKCLGIILLIVLIIAISLGGFFAFNSYHSDDTIYARGLLFIILVIYYLYLFVISPIAIISLCVLIAQFIKLRSNALLNWHDPHVRNNLILHLIILIPAIIYLIFRACMAL